MAWSKDYTTSTATSDGTLRPSKLHKQILDDALGQALEGVQKNPEDTTDKLRVTFAAELSAGDKTTLDATVAAHAAGSAPTSDFQFWESNSATTTTAETWTEKLSQVAAAVRGGKYRASWYFELKLTPSGA